MADKLEKETAAYNRVIEHSRRILETAAFQEVMPNFLEDPQVFLKSLGEDSDIVSKEMYLVGTTSGEKQFILRPELTASVARIAIERDWQYQVPKKVWYHGALFRHERPQKGRMRQFYQLGVEFLGAEDVQGDLEVLHLGCQVIRQLSRGKLDFVVEVNSIGDPEARTRYQAVLREYLSQPDIFARLTAEDQRRVGANPLRVLDSKDFQSLKLGTEIPLLRNYISAASAKTYLEILAGLKVLQIPFVENHALVRGLDYYNDFCFELKPAALGPTNKQVTLLAGGRYDGLLGTLSRNPKRNVKAVGFAMGIERLLLSLQESGADFEEEAYPALPLVVLREDKSIRPEDLLLRDRVKERFPGHKVDLLACKYSKIGDLVHRLSQTCSSLLIQGDEERAAGTLTKKDLVRRTTEQIAFK